MILMIKRILSYLSALVVISFLSGDINETISKKGAKNDMSSFYLRESARYMINYISNYEIDDPALKNSVKTFLKKFEKKKDMRGAMAEILATLMHKLNVGWLNPLFEEITKKEAEKTRKKLEDSLHGDDCIEDDYGMKCAVTAHYDALGVTNDAKVLDYMEAPFTNNSSDGYQYGSIIYGPKEKFDKNKIYRQNEIEDNYHDLSDTGDMAYQDLNGHNEDSPDSQDNGNLKETSFEESYPFNFMLLGNTDSAMNENSNKEEGLNKEIDSEYSNQQMKENGKIEYPSFVISHEEGPMHGEGAINEEDKTYSRNTGNINKAEKAHIGDKGIDYSYEITNHAVKSHESQVSVENGNENPLTNEKKSDSMKEMYYFETYDDEEIEENHAGFGRKLLEYNEEGESQVSVENGNENPLTNEKKSDSMIEMYYFETYEDEETEENYAGSEENYYFGRKLLEYNEEGNYLEPRRPMENNKKGKDIFDYGGEADYLQSKRSIEKNQKGKKVFDYRREGGDYLVPRRPIEKNQKGKKVFDYSGEGDYLEPKKPIEKNQEISGNYKSFLFEQKLAEGDFAEPNKPSVKKALDFNEEEISENNAGFGRKLLEYNEEGNYLEPSRPIVKNQKGKKDYNEEEKSGNYKSDVFKQVLDDRSDDDYATPRRSMKKNQKGKKDYNEEDKSENYEDYEYLEVPKNPVAKNLKGHKLLEYNEKELNENHTGFLFEIKLGDGDYLEQNKLTGKNLSLRMELNRVKRNYDSAAILKGCPVPPNLETVQGYCKSIPSKTTCHLYCIKGYTFPEGITRTLECSPNRGWDKGFEECKPYADCTLKLRSGGTLECALTTATKNAQCYVSCKRHGLYPAKGKRLYQCNALGLWTPVLPHCVVREGIDLVEPPPVVEHDSIDYP